MKSKREKKQKPLLVFDIDGVLIDVSRSYRLAIQETVKFFSGKSISQEEIQKIKIEEKLNNDWVVSQKLLERLGFEIPLEKVIERFQSFYLGKSFDGLILNEKTLVERQVLETLAGKAELCILTGRPRTEAEFALERFGISGFFKKTICMEDCNGKEKPNPFGLKLLDKYFKTKKCFYFGDTLADIECARKAGFKAVGILPPQDKSKALKEKMLKEGAAIVLENINNLPSVKLKGIASKKTVFE
ncbi:MAG TPA: HAD-IA family hydrolase [Candidatus Diapherotrites archaeon]|uniref:HAD-IA family hydrolase n=1 Tax=Candidatus Iainarchaeum sp. TaxID=3101447 RepID=A0A7J4L040_9ARCH|nr:HAD-IA family hydrolase [Candidatus Diapherotrites archaeon]